MEKKINPEIIRVNAERLFLDAKNPRLPESITVDNQEKIWEHMKKSYDLDELALSITNNGYFEAEPLVAIPKKKECKNIKEYKEYYKNKASEYIVVEGNRRLATIKGLLNGKLKNGNLDYDVSEELEEQFESLPVLFYPNRDDVLAFLGVHHLAGVRKWDVYERARYIVHLKKDKNKTMEEIQRIIGDRKNSAKKIYICYRLIEIVKDFDDTFNVQDAKANFSYLLLATGQERIRDFIGLPYWSNIDNLETFVANDKKEDLKFLFSCLFDNGDRGKLIKESRDITNYLSKIFNDEEAIKILKREKNIKVAYDFIGGELIGLSKLARRSKSDLEVVNGKLSGMDVKKTLEKPAGGELKENVDSISSIVKDIKKKYE